MSGEQASGLVGPALSGTIDDCFTYDITWPQPVDTDSFQYYQLEIRTMENLLPQYGIEGAAIYVAVPETATVDYNGEFGTDGITAAIVDTRTMRNYPPEESDYRELPGENLLRQGLVESVLGLLPYLGTLQGMEKVVEALFAPHRGDLPPEGSVFHDLNNYDVIRCVWDIEAWHTDIPVGMKHPYGVLAFKSRIPIKLNGTTDPLGYYAWLWATDRQTVPTQHTLGPLTFSPPGSGIVAYYPFDGTARDASGNANHGMEQGGVEYTSGLFGKAAEFDGVDDFIVVPDDDALDLRNELTLEVWVRPQQPDATPPYFILTKGGDKRCNYEFRLFTIDSAYFGFGKHSFWRRWKPRGQVGTDRWNHMVATYNSGDSSSARAFLNGEELQVRLRKDLYGSSLRPNDLPLFIGAERRWYPDGYVGFFKGLMDELVIYNRALAAAEIRRRYEAGASRVLPSEPDAPDALGKTRNSSWAARASGHLQTIAIALQMYNQDWDRLPTENWVENLKPYMVSVSNLSGTGDTWRKQCFAPDSTGDEDVVYALNERLARASLDTICRPTETIVVFESSIGGDSPVGGADDVLVQALHDGCICCLFADWNVRFIPVQRARELLRRKPF